MNTKKNVIITVLTACLIATLFMTVPSLSSPGAGDYDPWLDFNDDGLINMRDVGAVARAFGTNGTPINKTALLLDLQQRLDALNASILALALVDEGLQDQINHLTADLSLLESQLISLDTYVDNMVISFTNDITALELGVTFAHNRINDLTTRVTALEGRVDALEGTVTSLVDDLDGMKFGKAYSSGSDIVPFAVTYSGYLWWDHSAKALIACETNAYNGFWHVGGIRNQGTPAIPYLFNTWIDNGENETVATLNANGNWVTFDFTSEGPNAGYIRIHAYYANGRFVAHYSYRYQ